jgi:hypothetical protein
MTARYRDNITIPIEMQRIDRSSERFDDNLVSGGKAIAIRERCTVIDDRDVETKHPAQSGKWLGDVTGTNNDQALRADDRIDEQLRFPGGIIAPEQLRPARVIDFEQRRGIVAGAFPRCG